MKSQVSCLLGIGVFAFAGASLAAPGQDPEQPIATIPLSSAILHFLETPMPSPWWSIGTQLPEDAVIWKTVGIGGLEEGCGFQSCRRGTARFTISGVEMQRLGRRLEPVIWNLMLFSDSSSEMKPQGVMLQPDCGTVDCNFDIMSELSSALLNPRIICESDTSSNGITFIQITHGQNDYTIEFESSTGSSGESNWITIGFETNSRIAPCGDSNR